MTAEKDANAQLISTTEYQNRQHRAGGSNRDGGAERRALLVHQPPLQAAAPDLTGCTVAHLL